MNRQICRIFLFLSLAVLFVCLPAQAAHISHAGPSLPTVSSEFPAEATPESLTKASEVITGRSVSSPSLVQGGADAVTSGKAPAGPDPIDKSTQTGQGNTDSASSPRSDPFADSHGRSDPSTTGSADGRRDPGSPQEPEREPSGGIPDSSGQFKGTGLMAGMMMSPGGTAIPGPAMGSETRGFPAAGDSRGPSPQRQQHGPPAHSGSYPCGPAQASPLPPASGQTRDESKEETPSRQRPRRIGILSRIPDPIGPDPAPSSFPLQSLFPFNLLLIGGFRRISKKNVLEHDARQVIYQAITATPGIDVKTLTDMTGINENTLRYHVDRLVATGKISCLSRPGVVRYFQNQGAYSQFEHMMFHYLWTETPRGILWLLYQHPGLTRQHLADALAISGPSVTRQMDNLIEDGVVENRFPGRSNHYYLTAEAALTIDKVISQAPVMMHSMFEARPLSATAG